MTTLQRRTVGLLLGAGLLLSLSLPTAAQEVPTGAARLIDKVSWIYLRAELDYTQHDLLRRLYPIHEAELLSEELSRLEGQITHRDSDPASGSSGHITITWNLTRS